MIAHRQHTAYPYSRGLSAGIFAGIALGLFLKAAQRISGAKVYALLLNVDFVPGLNRPLPELLEFALHLAAAAALGLAFAWLQRRRCAPLCWGLLLGLAAVPLYVPLSLLSTRVPRLADGEAWLWWTAGHLVFGLTLALLGKSGRLVSRKPY